jgi:hypothetical protein
MLREIAAARSGDKGNISNISVWPYDRRHYSAIADAITPEAVKAAFPALIRGKVERYDLESLGGFNFVLHDALEGGVSASLGLDAHGKSFSFLILSLVLDIEVEEDQGAQTA